MAGPVLVGVFEDRARAAQVVQTLEQQGLTADRVGFVLRRGELIEARGALSAIDVPEHDLTGGLIGMGVPVEPARAYGWELERGRAIVTIQPVRLSARVARLLARAGAVSVLSWPATA